ncbi:MAG TPA: MFS transporter [Stellaceae bacterium]|nr:MFS transporter [Stellaceae bacterium]
MTQAALGGGAVPATPAARSQRPLVGVAAVLVGAFIATLNTRVTTFGLADIRGGLSLGFDEGSWLTSVFSAAQMIVAPGAAWMGTVFGTRRFLLWACAIFALSSLLLPFAGDYESVIALQIVRGLSVGTFIPAALAFILRSLPPHWWIWASPPMPSASSSRRMSAARSMPGIPKVAIGSGSSGRMSCSLRRWRR